MMLYGRLIHIVPFLAVGLLEACGGSAVTQPPRVVTAPGIAVGEPHPQPAPVIRDFDLLAWGDSGVTKAQNVVIRDAAELGALWAVHTSNRIPAPAVPEVDFKQKMVVGVFLGQTGNGCAGTGMHHVRDEGTKLVVSYEPLAAQTGICPAVIRTPSVLAVVDRRDAPVEFVAATSTPVAISTIEKTFHSNVKVARNVVVKDAAAWAALWAEHADISKPPMAIDFSRNMVVASFMGERPMGCFAVTLEAAFRAGSVVTVRRTLNVPGPTVLCGQAVTSPAHLVVMEKTDDKVVFATETVAL